MIASFAWAAARLTGILVVHPLWRASFPRGVGLVMAAAFAVSLAAATVSPDLLVAAGLFELAGTSSELDASLASFAASLGVEFAIGAGLGVLISLPFLGVVGGVRWAGIAAGCRGAGLRPWLRLHLLLTGWIFFASSPYVHGLEGLLRLSGLHAADGLHARELMALTAAPAALLGAVMDYAELSLVVAVAVCAPAIVAGAVVYAIADLGTVGHSVLREDIAPAARSAAMVAIVAAWTASWSIASVQRAMTLAPEF